ncbi:MAG: hypothetical protein ABI672_10760 [Vicinamibacteria bacterium]
MPIVASRGNEIRRLLGELSDPKRRAGAVLRLRALGARVVPHVSEDLGRLDARARSALLEALSDLDTNDAKALRTRLIRLEAVPGKTRSELNQPRTGRVDATEGVESSALGTLRGLPIPTAGERPSVTRERGEAHLTLARAGSRLARKDLLLSLETLPPGRTRLYCEAAGLIGDASFLEALARIGSTREEGIAAIASVATRERINARSKSVRDLDPALRTVVARALVGLQSRAFAT